MGGVARATVPWQVLIVEDDPSVVSMYKRIVGSFGNLEVAGIVRSGEDAMILLRRKRVDLILLDVTLPGASGVALLEELRAAGNPAEAIAMTACRDPETVRAIIHRGAVDYLVKPFSVDRMRQALGRFMVRRSALRNRQLDQEAVDRVCAAGRLSKRWLPKGLTQQGLASVNEALGAHGAPVTASDVARSTGLARVTARRYLEYLVATDQASVEAPPSGPGRPRKLYTSAA